MSTNFSNVDLLYVLFVNVLLDIRVCDEAHFLMVLLEHKNY